MNEEYRITIDYDIAPMNPREWGNQYEYIVEKWEMCTCGEHGEWEWVDSCGGIDDPAYAIEQAKESVPEEAEVLVVKNV